jgi:hypothetical protein
LEPKEPSHLPSQLTSNNTGQVAQTGGFMANPTPPVSGSHAYRDDTLAIPNLTPEAVVHYNAQARRLEERKRRRPIWKTIIFGGLLYALTPLGGNAIAHIYVHTRNNPDEFRFGQAWASGWIAFFCFLITVTLAVGILWLVGSITGFVQDGGQVDDIPRYINQLLQRR